MILFADTSAFIKLYFDEIGSVEMAERVGLGRLALSVLAYAEVYAAFARRRRESLLSPKEHTVLCARFEEDWQAVIRVASSPAARRWIPGLCADFPLRGADAVHLASALELRDAGLEVAFAASDGRLTEAAETLALEVFDPARASRTGDWIAEP